MALGIRKNGLGLLIALCILVWLVPPVSALDSWYNNTWHYRTKLVINASSWNRTDWIVERDLNFTSLLKSMGGGDTAFDNNSLRVFEYNSTGGIAYEVPSQFDFLDDYNNLSNAYGTLLFRINGTMAPNTSRTYLVYFDEAVHGAKSAPAYPAVVNVSTSGTTVSVNNSLFEFGLDTARGQNTSGLYRIKELNGAQNTLFDDAPTDPTTEYTQFSDGLYNYTFNFTGNVTFKNGPVRLTVTLTGNETYWDDPLNFTGAGRMVKRYRFYDNSSWVKIELNYTDVQGSPVTRNSTDSGAVAFDVSDSANFPNPRGFGAGYRSFGNDADPYSYTSANDQFASFQLGLVHLNESGTTNFSVRNDSAFGRIGVHLNAITVAAGASIADTALMAIDPEAANFVEFQKFRNAWADRENVTQTSERWNVTVVANSSFATYNRNETVKLFATVLSDVYNFTSLMNVSVDNATPAVPGDDFALQLYDDGTHGDAVAGDHVYTNNFTLNTTANVSALWGTNATAWDSHGLYLGFQNHSFNVTDAYRVNLTVLTPLVVAGTPVNASLFVSNYRQDTPITGAAVSCNYSVSQVFDFNNGTYIVTFASPLIPSLAYALSCNATQAGNYGANQSAFAVDAAATNLSVTTNPSSVVSANITQANNNTFVLLVAADNTANGTAIAVNLTLQLPPGWSANSTSHSCGNVSVGGNCQAAFLVTIPNATVPGNYTANASASWKNPDASSASNLTTAEIDVRSNPVMNLTPTLLFSYVAPGVLKAFGSFNVSSVGNDLLGVVAFTPSASPFTIAFDPANLPSLAAGSAQNVSINVTAPVGTPTGNYTVVVNVSTNNSGYQNLTLVVGVSGTNLTLSISPTSVVSANITQQNNNTFVVTANVSNPGNITAFSATLFLGLTGNFTSNASTFACGTLNVTENCSAQFLVTLRARTRPDNFTLNVTVNWTTPEVGIADNVSNYSVDVLSNPVLNLTPLNLSGNATHGNTTTLTNFTLNSTGNDDVLNLTYLLSAFPDFNVTLVGNDTNLTAGTWLTVFVNVTVPLFYDPGSTGGWLYLNTSNALPYNLTLQVNVSEDRSWTLSTDACGKTESPDAGDVCEVLFNNTGNIFINFSLVPPSANFSALNVSAINLSKFGNYRLKVTYNVSGQPKINYTSNYNFTVANGNGAPAFRILTVTLIPFASLLVTLAFSPNRTEQLGSVVAYANATDANLVGIQNVTLNVTDPQGNVTSLNMTFLRTNGTVYEYSVTFPNVTGSTLYRGAYRALATATDSILVEGNVTANFTVYANLVATMRPLASVYAPGDTVSFYFKSQDAANATLSPVNTTITITNPDNLTVFNNSYTTDPTGIVLPLPQWSIASDQPLGNYTVSAYSTYYDGNVSLVVNDLQDANFQLSPSGAGNVSFSGLVVSLEAGGLWYANQQPEMTVSVYDVNGTPIDPDSMNFTVLAPNDTVFANGSLQNFTRRGPGLYSWKNFTVNANTSGGVYLVLLNASHGEFTTTRATFFRVASSLLLDVGTAVVWYPASVMRFDVVLRSSDGLPMDPDSLNLTVYDPANNVYLQVPFANFTKQASGFYFFKYNMPAGTGTGAYVAYVNASKQGMVTQNVHPFRVASGGPYDVRLELIDNQVAQGDYLDFRIVVINQGEVSQDVLLEYWTEAPGGQVWYFASEAVLVPAHTQQSFVRSAYTYTSQPSGSYFLKLRMTYDLVQPPIFANASYLVSAPSVTPVATATPAPPGGGPAGGPVALSVTPSPPGGAPPATPTPAGAPKLTLVAAPEEVVAESGETKYLKIDARNDGLALLHNLTLFFSGVPPAWLEIRPSRVNSLAPGDVGSFSVKLVVPKSEKTGVRSLRALVVGDEAQDEKQFNLVVFESRAALLEYELQQLDTQLGKLSKDAKDAETLGKDVDAIWSLLEEAGAYKNLARDELRKDQLDDALANVRLSSASLSKATTLLAAAGFRQGPLVGIPWWVFLLVILLAFGLAYSGYRYARRKGLLPKAPASPMVLAPALPEKVLDTKDAEALERERDKIRRVLRLLEEELHQGVISQAAYRELRARNERKLQGIERKLREAGL